MTTSITTTVDLLRHGEPVGGSRYRGQTDDPLSDKGWTQMRTAVGDAHPWDHIVSSPLCRCSDFARELVARHALPLTLDPRLMELGFGAWEGRTADAMERVKRLEAALEAMPQSQPKVESPDTARAAELDRVVGFLREEIKAAQETIGRLKEQSLTPAAKPSRSKR